MDTAAGFQGSGGFGGIVDGQPPAPPVSQMMADLLSQMAQVDHHPLKTRPGQARQMILDQGPSTRRQQGFGGGIGQGAHPLPPSGGQDHRPHDPTP